MDGPWEIHVLYTSSSSFSIRHSFTSEDLVSAPNLELGCAMILHNCASDYIQTVLVVQCKCRTIYILADAFTR